MQTICCCFALLCSVAEITAQDTMFALEVVDKATGRGIPMVRLTTVNGIDHYTDSAGLIAFNEPGMMDKEVFFHIWSHGYEYPEDGFGYRGVRVRTTPGQSARIEIERKNIAERLYRITGQGIYRDSMLLGRGVPIAEPSLNGDVLGQDTVQTAIYNGRIYWFWGDTNRPSYPLGQFKTSGATSMLPHRGLDPALGVNLKYFVDDKGFSRQMAPVDGPGAVWLHGLFVLQHGDERLMIAHYARVQSLAKRYEHGLVLFNDQTQTFEKLVQFPDDALLYPRGQALVYEEERPSPLPASSLGDNYIYFATPFPSVRVKASLDSIVDPAQYESYTCLRAGTRYDKDDPLIDRDQGAVTWNWKRDTDPVDARRQLEMIRRGHLKDHERLDHLELVDPENKQPVYLHSGSVHWNDHRQKWIMVGLQFGGKSSFIGEMWYAESNHLTGPWENARHIVTHEKYSFYNPAHHRFLDQENGRLIYFEGTYATTFSAAQTPTPRYNYNQIMYRLDLADPRLGLDKDD